ncbi:MAG: VWA domain-containing protein, partial [Lysobacteraceae bacterium]
MAVIAGCNSTAPIAAEAPTRAPAEVPSTDQAAGLDRVEVTGSRMRRAEIESTRQAAAARKLATTASAPPPPPMAYAPVADQAYLSAAPLAQTAPTNTENYQQRVDNPVQRASEQPVSTFSVDVDTGSYSNVRRMLREGVRPPADSVRAEEFINYFGYQHPAPADRSTPFRVTTELAAAPWNPQRQLLMIGIKGYDVPKATLPASNLVFLLDTSGSMDSPDKLPLLKQAFAMLVPQLRAQDRVSIVVYAGSAGLVLAPTPGDRQAEILAALERLQAGGSTNGGDGIRLAYAMARQGFIKDGVNRVIL